MKYTPAQVLQIVGVSTQTLRYWKAHLSPLSAKRGHAPSYTKGDLLALIVVQQLVYDFKMDVSAVSTHADKLFRLCQACVWPQQSAAFLVFNASGISILDHAPSAFDVAVPSVVFPVQATIHSLNERLNEQEQEAQLDLNLPPVAVRKAGGRT